MKLTIKIKEVDEYLDWCYKNPEKINQERWDLIKNIVEPTLCRTDIYFNYDMYNHCLNYIKKWYYEYFPYQKFLAAMFFLFEKETDDVVFKVFVIVMGRGNGKDGFIAPLCNFLQIPLYGIRNYNIDLVATSEEQINDTFDVVYDVLNDNREFFKSKFWIGKEKIMNFTTKSILRINTSNVKTKDGKKTGLVVFNEYHEYVDKKKVDVYTSGAGKIPHFRQVIITTQGDVRGGLLDETLETCFQVLKGMYPNLRYFPFICKLNNPAEVDNPEKWILANPSIDYMPNLKKEITDQYNEMKIIPSKRAVFMTKRMNIPEREEAKCAASWDDILETKSEEIPNFDGKDCLGGLDYCDINDFCGCVLEFKKDGKRYFKHHTFICSKSRDLKDIKFDINLAVQKGLATIVEGPTLDQEVVVRWFLDAAKKYNILGIAMDTFRYALLRETFSKYGLYPKDRQHPDGVLYLVRNASYTHNRVAPMIDEMFSRHTVIFGDDMMMRWYVNNTAVEIDGKGNKTYKKIEPRLRKNDGFMAVVHVMSIDELLIEKKASKDMLGAITF